MHFEYAALADGEQSMPLKAIKKDGSVELIALDNTDPLNAFGNEISAVVDAVRTGKPSEILNGDLARDAIAICHAQSKSIQQQRQVRIEEIFAAAED